MPDRIMLILSGFGKSDFPGPIRIHQEQFPVAPVLFHIVPGNSVEQLLSGRGDLNIPDTAE
jgi:hypothetical protein